jgi:hypothetical protein
VVSSGAREATYAVYFHSMLPKPPFPPLTSDQLREIPRRAPIAAVRRLLWEIHRLRALVLRANDFVRMAKLLKENPKQAFIWSANAVLEKLVGPRP